MIQTFVDRYMERKHLLEAKYKDGSPYDRDYMELVKDVVGIISDEDADSYGQSPDPERVHEIDDGDYQGTHVYVIGARGYQPSTYWYCRMSYGSCSGCDALQGADSVDEIMSLCLHIVQRMKLMDDEE